MRGVISGYQAGETSKGQDGEYYLVYLGYESTFQIIETTTS